MNENEELLDGIQRAQDELDAVVSAWNRVMLKAMCAAANERATIVSWLRSPDQSDDDKLNLYWANEIEAGEHLK